MTIIANAFSLNMLRNPSGAKVSIKAVEPSQVASLDLESAIGHADTAAVVGGLLGVDLPANRSTVTLDRGDTLVVAQFIGPRLPEGSVTLPEGARVDFFMVEIS